MNISRIIKVMLLAVFLMLSTNVFSQITEIGFENRVANSQLVIEGKVISKRSFWDVKKHNIYTANEIEVYKTFKGNTLISKLEIITPGGSVGFKKDVVKPSLNLSVNDIGIFMLKENTIPIENPKKILQFKPYASLQGFIKYDLDNNKASSAFDRFNSIENELYNSIIKITNTEPVTILSFLVNSKRASQNNVATTITDFYPTTATAGTTTTITINGSDFGTTTGSVGFSNANDAGATFVTGLATEIISWNNTQIVAEVISNAGTGPIQVVGNSTTTSTQTLMVTYAETNVSFDLGTGNESYQTRHVDRNGNGGYIWQMHTDFDANNNANTAFMRAFNSWRCSTGINWEIGAVTTIDVMAADNINVIRHDNGNELEPGVLGLSISRFNGCFVGANLKWYVKELDIIFDDGTNWNYSTNAPGATEYDFESVVVHELGHVHQLGHVIDTNDVMHYSTSNGVQRRILTTNALAGARDVQSRSTGDAVCAYSLMTNYSCPPVAVFNVLEATICEGETVNFNDLSTNTPTSWNWSFSGGVPSTSTDQNPTITYNTPGTYQVTLTVTNASGSDDEIKNLYITVVAKPKMDLQGNNTSIVSGDSTPDILDHTTFESVYFGSFTDRTFTIENTGNVSLLLSGSPTVSITGSTDFSVITDPSTTVSSGGGTTTFTVRYTPSMASTINTATLSIDNNDCNEIPYTFDIQGISLGPVLMAVNVYLQGAALNPNMGEETLMCDNLRVAGLLPTATPYSDGAICDAAVFNTTGNDAIVDWVWVELRDATTNTTVVHSRSALLQRDGDVVTTDGISPVPFNAASGNYYVAIKHRNHLGVMTANTVALSSTTTVVTFTDANNKITFGTNAQTTLGMPINTIGMWAGDVNGDGIMQYTGATPDSPSILSSVLNDVGNFLNLPTFIVNGYTTNDIDMNGSFQYTGATPDTPFILQNALVHPGNFLNLSTYSIIEQLPEN